jgi:hypothetical protein
MNNWVAVGKLHTEVPIRSSGNTVKNIPVAFDVYKDSTVYKAIPLCDKQQKVLANLKDEVLFSFQHGRAISVNGIKDGNQHVVESIGALLKSQGMAAEVDE